MYQGCGETIEAIRVRLSIGSFYILLGKYREGIRLLREGLGEARSGAHRRLEALAWTNLGEAYYLQGDHPRATKCFRESNALAIHNNEKYPDILFHSAFYEWKMAAEIDNPTRARIAFGRLKVLRSSLERRFAEVDEFDEHVEGGRAHA
jgi:tetratricopeptide (TPR) repeat protein